MSGLCCLVRYCVNLHQNNSTDQPLDTDAEAWCSVVDYVVWFDTVENQGIAWSLKFDISDRVAPKRFP